MMSKQKERKLQRGVRVDNKTPFRREKASERASLRVMDWLRQRRIYRGIRDVPLMPSEDSAPKNRS